MDNDVRAGIFQQREYAIQTAEVVVGAARNENVLCAARLQRFDHVRTEEACAPGDDEAVILPEAHRVYSFP
jgi:hypothetical protein